MFINGNPVCDDGWNLIAAHVVCKQLNFSRAVRTTNSSKFGLVGATYAMDDVVCQGNETQLGDCQHATEDNCDATEAAGVVCDPRTPAQIAALEERLTRECFVKDMTYKTDTISLDTVASVLDCQDYCVTTRGCSHFTYTASSKECKLLTGEGGG